MNKTIINNIQTRKLKLESLFNIVFDKLVPIETSGIKKKETKKSGKENKVPAVKKGMFSVCRLKCKYVGIYCNLSQ